MSDERGLPPLDHLVALSDDTGLVQHATRDVANRSTGYCTDDVARGFMVALAAADFEHLRETALSLARVYLAFLMDAQLPDGRFHNFMSYGRMWLDAVGSDDSNGRALWALGFGMRFSPRPQWRDICRDMFGRAFAAASASPFAHARAYAALGLAHARAAPGPRQPALDVALRALGDDLAQRHRATAGARWDWFENEMTYDNARLPEALLRIGVALEETRFIELGKRTLDFYRDVTLENNLFVPIGNAGWYVRGGVRARYAQQPLEAASLVDAGLAAARATGDEGYRELAELGLAWFHGRNTGGIVVAAGGGCYDGLEENGANQNMGAESTLAYLSSALALALRLPAAAAIAR